MPSRSINCMYSITEDAGLFACGAGAGGGGDDEGDAEEDDDEFNCARIACLLMAAADAAGLLGAGTGVEAAELKVLALIAAEALSSSSVARLISLIKPVSLGLGRLTYSRIKRAACGSEAEIVATLAAKFQSPMLTPSKINNKSPLAPNGRGRRIFLFNHSTSGLKL